MLALGAIGSVVGITVFVPWRGSPDAGSLRRSSVSRRRYSSGVSLSYLGIGLWGTSDLAFLVGARGFEPLTSSLSRNAGHMVYLRKR